VGDTATQLPNNNKFYSKLARCPSLPGFLKFKHFVILCLSGKQDGGGVTFSVINFEAMELYLTDFESIVQRHENIAQSTDSGSAYDKLSEV